MFDWISSTQRPLAVSTQNKFDHLMNWLIHLSRSSEGKQQFKEGCCDISQINTVDRLTEKIISRWTWNKIILTTSSWSRFSLWTQTENNVLRINVRSQWIWPLTFHVQYLTSSWGASGLCENQVKGRASFCVRPPPVLPARPPAGDRLKCQTEQDWSETSAPGCQPVHSSSSLPHIHPFISNADVVPLLSFTADPRHLAGKHKEPGFK